MRKLIFDIIFITSAAITLILLHEFGWIEKHGAFSLIPMLIAYFLGQYSERKFRSK